MSDIPTVAQQLQRELNRLFGFQTAEEKRKETTWDKLERALSPENMFLILTMSFFMLVGGYFIISASQGRPDYLSLVFSVGANVPSLYSRLRQRESRQRESLNLGNSLMDRQYKMEELIREHSLKESQLNFFTRELIGTIMKSDENQLESINLALQALIYDKEGILHKEIKEIHTLLATRHSEETAVLAELRLVRERLPKNGVFNGEKKREIEAAMEAAAQYKEISEEKEQLYDYLMNNLPIGVILLDSCGIITDANSYAKDRIPGIAQGFTQHWTWNMSNRGPQQISLLMKIINDGLIGIEQEKIIKNYQFADNTVGNIRIRTIPVKTGDIVEQLYLTVEILNSGPSQVFTGEEEIK
ncbi:hypothetical protein KAR91_56885 [Candidatus Pacearchaeota archaeon]|nr:hypothetical protein [Candidatus Pacearchaeota archaeon]